MGQKLLFQRHVQGPEAQIVFSLADGYVWASFPGAVASVRLGTCEAVTTMMGDFLAQCALGERLSETCQINSPA